jgi:hypothetical protein
MTCHTQGQTGNESMLGCTQIQAIILLPCHTQELGPVNSPLGWCLDADHY